MFQKLDDVVLKHEELTKLLMDPEVISDPKKIMEYNKALNSIDEVVKKYTYYKTKKEEVETLKEDLKSEKDPEMKEMMRLSNSTGKPPRTNPENKAITAKIISSMQYSPSQASI